MRIDRAGLPFILAALAPAAALAAVRQPIWAAPFAAAAAFFLYFFRDPERTTPEGTGHVLAPADGRVLVAGQAEAADAPPGPWRQVSIFLSPLDVHVNRAPVSGRVVRVDYRPGRFLPAYRRDAGTVNECNELWIDHEGQTIVCRQVVGILARRIVCRVAAGERVEAGQRIGLMKFGSRVDVFVPPTAALRVRAGETVVAGETVLATLSGGG